MAALYDQIADNILKNQEIVQEMKDKIKAWTAKRGVRGGFLDLSEYAEEGARAHTATTNAPASASGSATYPTPTSNPSYGAPGKHTTYSSARVPSQHDTVCKDTLFLFLHRTLNCPTF